MPRAEEEESQPSMVAVILALGGGDKEDQGFKASLSCIIV